MTPLYARFATMDEKALARDSQAMGIGERLFINNCATCHGSDARGSKGFPNLTDNDWLWGGGFDTIQQTIAKGRVGAMPPMAAAVGSSDDVRNVAHYVLSLSGSPHDSVAAQLGRSKFTACAACHGVDGKGNQALGAPNLTDKIWLHGWGESTIVAMVNGGKTNVMPAHAQRLSAEQIRVLAAYVWSLSNHGRRNERHAAPTDGTTQVIWLYEKQKKIYPRAVSGWFAGWRWALVWATQADLLRPGRGCRGTGARRCCSTWTSRRFYLFDLVLYPQDFIYLTGLLIISAYALFLFTAVAGRLWCGYACPQTVYTEIFMWLERLFEGDRMARIKRDAAPWGAEKLLRKGAKHGAWITLSLWTGFTFVGYFTPIRSLWAESFTLDFGPWEWFWVLFYGLATYGNAGFLREQVCKYMCPYARFQSAMFDRDTLIISYDAERGEPRGQNALRGRSTDLKAGQPGRLHRLQAVRAGLPDRHRHPQGPAVRMHRLRRLHRRLRRRDGQDAVPARADPLRHARTAWPST